MASPAGHVTARDGIVGPWLGAHSPAAQAFADPAHLSRWGAPSQSAVLLNEVLSRVIYTADTATGRVLIHLIDNQGGSQTAPALNLQLLAELSAPTVADFAQQAEIVHNYADLRLDRMIEITDQTAGTLPYFARLLPMMSAQTPKTLLLLDLVVTVAGHVAQQCKHLLACHRPDALSAQIQPIIATPSHSALPSGHATESFAVAETLCRLLPEGRKPPGFDAQVMQMAARIAVNRTVAGVHFPADSFAGAGLGFMTADVVRARTSAVDTIPALRFSGAGIGRTDFFLSQVWQAGARREVTSDGGATILSTLPGNVGTDLSPILDTLWRDAVAEWA